MVEEYSALAGRAAVQLAVQLAGRAPVRGERKQDGGLRPAQNQRVRDGRGGLTDHEITRLVAAGALSEIKAACVALRHEVEGITSSLNKAKSGVYIPSDPSWLGRARVALQHKERQIVILRTAIKQKGITPLQAEEIAVRKTLELSARVSSLEKLVEAQAKEFKALDGRFSELLRDVVHAVK